MATADIATFGLQHAYTVYEDDCVSAYTGPISYWKDHGWNVNYFLEHVYPVIDTIYFIEISRGFVSAGTLEWSQYFPRISHLIEDPAIKADIAQREDGYY